MIKTQDELDIEIRAAVSETQYRSAQSEVVKIDREARTVELSFASELEVSRWYGIEVLRMTEEAADLSRLNTGGAVLAEHDRTIQNGVVEKAWIGDDKRGHALVRFSRNKRADAEFQDICDRIRQLVSFGYVIINYDTERLPEGGGEKVTATRWMAVEISIVSIPEDASVGIGRSKGGVIEPVKEAAVAPVERGQEIVEIAPAAEVVLEAKEQNRGSKIIMADVVENVAGAVFTREQEILDYGKMFGEDALARSFAADPNKSLADLQTAVRAKFTPEKTTPASPEAIPTELGLTEKEARSYSMSRAILATADGNWKGAEFEKECSEEIEQRMGRSSAGFFVPLEVQNVSSVEQRAVQAMRALMGQRDLSVAGGGAAGAYLVGTDHMPQSFIDVLRSKMVMLGLGVQVMSGLVGNPSIPRQNGAATGYWVSEGQAPATSDPVFGQLGLNPKTCGATTEFTRQLLLQSAPSVDMLVKSDIAEVLARTVDLAIISGSGSAGQPTGILSTSGVSEVSMIGGSFAFADAVAHETAIGEANAPDGASYLMRPSVRGALKTRVKDSNTAGIYLIGDSGELNGYGTSVTTQMPAATLIFGVYNQIILGEWGVLEIEANRLGAGFRAGNIEVRGLHSVDVAIRYPQAFKKLTAFA